MAWTTPKTDWATGELVAASDMNEIGENLAALKNPATASFVTTENIEYDTNNDFRDVDSTNLNLTITSNGGDVLVHFDGLLMRVHHNRNTENCLDIEIDGSRQGGDYGLFRSYHNGQRETESFTRLISNLSAGSHTFKLQWKNSEGMRLYAGAQFWVREI